MQVVKTDKGYVSGAITGEPGKEVSVFRGIPYAAPPVGPLRWKPPRPSLPWPGIRECTHFSAISPQLTMPGVPSTLPLSEDCLYLNVITPARKADEKLPVMVWLHGGGYSIGSGNDDIWNNYRLPQYGVVVVTITHRLGPFGLAAHPALSKESPNGVSGNYLFMDIIASLQWIQKNITAFGGNPNNVTIFGESGGGAKVSVMMSSPFAKGLFHKAICESGTALAFDMGKSLADMEKYGEKLFEYLGVKTLEEARKAPWDKILEASQSIKVPPSPGRDVPVPPWDAAIDGWMLPKSPFDAFNSGAINTVPLIVSANLGELTGPSMLVIPMIIPAYVEMLKAINKAGQNAFALIFDQVPAHWRKEGGVSAHSIELPYVFGDWDNTSGWWKSIAMFMQSSGAKSPDIILGADDKYISEAVMGLWTSFAKSGKPKLKDAPEWPAWQPDTDLYYYLNGTAQVKAGFSKAGQDK
jgi:para-nitrobenzyl esterase